MMDSIQNQSAIPNTPAASTPVWYLRRSFTPLLIALLTFLAFMPVIFCDFINLDDNGYIERSPQVTAGLCWSSIKEIVTSRQLGLYHPLSSLTFLIDYSLFELDPAGYHIINLLIHVASVVLLFYLLRQITGSHWRSAIATTLFAVHPLRVESVAWVSERKDLLFFFFAIVTFLAYIHYARKPRPGRYLLMIPPFLLSLLAKPMLVTLPALLLLLDFWPLRRFPSQENANSPFPLARPRMLLIEKTPLLLISIAWMLLILLLPGEATKASATTQPAANPNVANVVDAALPADATWRAGNALISYIRYLVKTVDTRHLSCYYAPVQWSLLQIASAGVALLLISAGAVMVRRRFPCLTFGWFWFLVSLLPVIGILQISGYSLADRYTYLPAIGLMVAAVWLLPAHLSRSRWAQCTLAAAILLSCILTARQCQTWHDSISLWQHGLQAGSDTWAARNNYGAALQDSGDLDGAAREYQQTLRLAPDLALAKRNLADLQKIREVVDHYAPLFQANPSDYLSRCDLVDALIKIRQPAIALVYARDLIDRFPDSPYVQVRVGVAMFSLGHFRDATAAYNKALAIEPENSDALANLGFVYANRGHYEQAIDYYQRALKSDPQAATVHMNLGVALAQLDRNEEALAQYRTALQLNPKSARTHNHLGRLFLRTGNPAAAAAEAEQSLQLVPNNSEARKLLKQAREKLPATLPADPQ